MSSDEPGEGVPTGDETEPPDLGTGLGRPPAGSDAVAPDEVMDAGAPGEARRVPQGPGDFPPEGPNSLASIGRRVVARLIDAALLLVPVLVIVLPAISDSLDETGSGDDVTLPDIGLGRMLVAVLVPIVYETLFVAGRGATPGKMAMGLRVADLSTGGNPPVTQAGIRVLLPTLIGAVPVPGFDILGIIVYVSAIWHPMRRGWHDRAAGTVVVSVR